MIVYRYKTFVSFMVASLVGNVNPSAATPWIDATVPAGIEGQSLSRLKFADLNGDRRPDAILLPKSKQGILPRVFLNRSEESDEKISFRLEAFTETNLPSVRTADTLVFADLNNDGMIDLLVTETDGAAQLLFNRIANDNHWLSVRVIDPALNRDALGTKVVVETDTGARISRWLSPSVGYCSTSDFRLHFGLGESASIKNIIVTWPGKILQRYAGVEVDQFITLSRGSTEITLN